MLSAFLILQMDTLSEMAAVLGKEEDSRKWKERGDSHFARFKEHFWVDGELVARLSGSHKKVTADSNYMYLPIVLGERLPADMREWLVKGLSEQGNILTPSGLATESPRSPFYESNSYCRGPVWAPTMLILADGLRRSGAKDLAEEAAKRFCDTVKNSYMAECFDALTGAPYRDPAYTWTASVFLLLASEYIGN